MNIEAFLLCDAATDSSGKLNVLGAFDYIYMRQMPGVHSACAVVVRIRFSKIEEGSHAVRVSVIDEDGKAVLPNMDGNLAVRVDDKAGSAVANLILHIGGLKFEKYGAYRIDIAIDGKLEGSLPFTVGKPPNKN